MSTSVLTLNGLEIERLDSLRSFRFPGIDSSLISALARAETGMTPFRDSILESAASNPIVRSVFGKIVNKCEPGTAIRTPEDVWAERWRICILAGSYDHRKSADERKAVRAVLAKIAMATPYLVINQVRDSIFASELPGHVVSRTILPEPLMFVTFEGSSSETVVGGVKYETWAYVLQDAAGYVEAIAVVAAGQYDGQTYSAMDAVEFLPFRIDYGSTYDPTEPTNRARLAGRILRLLSFFRSRYIPKTVQRLSRDARKQMQRETGDRIDPRLVFVDLRRPENTGMKDSGTDAGSRHNRYSRRWIVSGHHRAQWFPSESAHHLIWVAPYVKGPDGAPIMPRMFRGAR